MSLSTHILDTALGRPAPGISVVLEQLHDETWKLLSKVTTDPDGRARGFSAELRPGIYRLHFDTAPYFALQGLFALYPFIEITFTVVDSAAHLHIPLLLTANGYTTYRGS